MKKVKVKMRKPVYSGLSILEIKKIIMYEFWYDYMKKKYGDMVMLCYMDTDSLIMNIKTKDFYKDIARDVEERFDTSNYGDDRPLPKGKNKKVIDLMKDEYLSTFWRTLELPLINCEVNLILTWSSTCVLIATNIPNQNATFAITDTKLYVPVVTLSTQENTKFLQ